MLCIYKLSYIADMLLRTSIDKLQTIVECLILNTTLHNKDGRISTPVFLGLSNAGNARMFTQSLLNQHDFGFGYHLGYWSLQWRHN